MVMYLEGPIIMKEKIGGLIVHSNLVITNPDIPNSQL